MYPLIEITTVPIEIKMTTKSAQLEYSRGTAEMEVSRDDKGGLSIKSRPVRLQMDTYEARNSIRPTTMRSVEQSAEKGMQAAYEATATYARQGELLVNAKVGQELVTQFAAEQATKDYKPNVGLTFLPSVPPEINWQEGDMEIRYEMDKLNFDWKIDKGEFKFTPGDIEISVEQQPEVVIKYVGGPIYVPPSADPNYEPIDVKV